MVTRRFARRSVRPSRQWTELASTWSLNATATTGVVLWGLQSPAAGTGLTSLPPEDVIIMRIRGSFLLGLSAATSQWMLGLTVQDQAWTPSAVFQTDADKRWLWTQAFQTVVVFPKAWTEAGDMEYTNASTFYSTQQSCTMVDIAPKVKLEAGQGLYLVAYETTGASTLTSSSTNMRMLWQTKARR